MNKLVGMMVGYKLGQRSSNRNIEAPGGRRRSSRRHPILIAIGALIALVWLSHHSGFFYLLIIGAVIGLVLYKRQHPQERDNITPPGPVYQPGPQYPPGPQYQPSPQYQPGPGYTQDNPIQRPWGGPPGQSAWDPIANHDQEQYREHPENW